MPKKGIKKNLLSQCYIDNSTYTSSSVCSYLFSTYLNKNRETKSGELRPLTKLIAKIDNLIVVFRSHHFLLERLGISISHLNDELELDKYNLDDVKKLFIDPIMRMGEIDGDPYEINQRKRFYNYSLNWIIEMMLRSELHLISGPLTELEILKDHTNTCDKHAIEEHRGVRFFRIMVNKYLGKINFMIQKINKYVKVINHHPIYE